MFSLSPPRIPIQKKKTFSCGVVYKVKVEDERRAKILGALNGAEAIKDQCNGCTRVHFNFQQ